VDTTIDRQVARVSALWYTGISLGVVGTFLILVRLVGGYPPAAIYGGAVWSFLLSMIVTMPLVTAYFKRRARAEG
jgi:hypothetical protein